MGKRRSHFVSGSRPPPCSHILFSPSSSLPAFHHESRRNFTKAMSHRESKQSQVTKVAEREKRQDFQNKSFASSPTMSSSSESGQMEPLGQDTKEKEVESSLFERKKLVSLSWYQGVYNDLLRAQSIFPGSRKAQRRLQKARQVQKNASSTFLCDHGSSPRQVHSPGGVSHELKVTKGQFPFAIPYYIKSTS